MLQLLHDTTALTLCGVLVFLQFVTGGWIADRTLLSLTRGRKVLRQTQAAVGTISDRSALIGPTLPPVVRRAVRAVYGVRADEEVTSPDEAFAPERLLPSDYQPRLDAAAPGTFTAIGILGTFLGLITAFGKVNLADPTGSIQPLLGGMTTAFVNSIVGVAAAIVWTLGSRAQRHGFDVACAELQDAVQERFGAPSHGTQILDAFATLRAEVSGTRADVATALGEASSALALLAAAQQTTALELAGELRGLRAATSGASRDLLDSLAPRLESAFRTLIDTPFERLSESVERFHRVVDESAVRHEHALAAMSGSTEVLAQSQAALAGGLEAARAVVDEFAAANDALKESTTAASGAVDESRRAATAFRETAAAIADTSQQQARTAEVLGGAAAELQLVAVRLPESAAEITRAGKLLRRQLRDALHGLDQSVRALDAGSTETLAARLAEYDAMVAKATDHFSGTLLGWDGRIADVGAVARDLGAGLGEARRDLAAALAAAADLARLAQAQPQPAERATLPLGGLVPPNGSASGALPGLAAPVEA